MLYTSFFGFLLFVKSGGQKVPQNLATDREEEPFCKKAGLGAPQ